MTNFDFNKNSRHNIINEAFDFNDVEQLAMDPLKDIIMNIYSLYSYTDFERIYKLRPEAKNYLESQIYRLIDTPEKLQKALLNFSKSPVIDILTEWDGAYEDEWYTYGIEPKFLINLLKEQKITPLNFPKDAMAIAYLLAQDDTCELQINGEVIKDYSSKYDQWEFGVQIYEVSIYSLDYCESEILKHISFKAESKKSQENAEICDAFGDIFYSTVDKYFDYSAEPEKYEPDLYDDYRDRRDRD